VPFGWVRRWMALRPAWSAAALILVGLELARRWWLGFRSVGGRRQQCAVNVTAVPRFEATTICRRWRWRESILLRQWTLAPGTLPIAVRTNSRDGDRKRG